MENYESALEKNAAELTVVDVYDAAAVIGHEFERIINQYGCDVLLGLMPKVVRVLELLEELVCHSAASSETEELRRELDRLRRERNDRYEKEKIHQQELELVEDVWRGEAQDLLSQITQLQTENQRLLVRLSLQDLANTGEELQKHEGMSEKEQQVMKKLKDMVDKQRDEIRAKDHELSLRNEDLEALQMQQHRLMRINQDLRHRIGVMEAQGKALIQQRAKLEAVAQACQQELGALQLEVNQLKKEHHEWEQEREFAELEESFPTVSGTSIPISAKAISPEETTAESIKLNSVWEECKGDTDFLHESCKSEKHLPQLASSTNRTKSDEDYSEDEEKPDLLSGSGGEEEPEDEIDRPRFTLQELQDVLLERNELKAQVFMLHEELAYYKSEDLDDEGGSDAPAAASPPCAAAADHPESGIRRLIFTAIMPMVAAGLIRDDPTLLPIRRLISFV